MIHTPGPWIASGAWVENPDENKADICSCHPADFGQEHLGWDYDEVCANARLIAAAPELLEALEYALSDLSDLEYAEKDCTWEGQRMYAINPFVIERVRNSIAAAISRARGEQP